MLIPVCKTLTISVRLVVVRGRAMCPSDLDTRAKQSLCHTFQSVEAIRPGQLGFDCHLRRQPAGVKFWC